MFNRSCQCGFYSDFWSWTKGMFSRDWRYCSHGTNIPLKIGKASSYLQAIFCQKRDASKKELYSWLIIYSCKMWKLERVFEASNYNSLISHRRTLRLRVIHSPRSHSQEEVDPGINGMCIRLQRPFQYTIQPVALGGETEMGEDKRGAEQGRKVE